MRIKGIYYPAPSRKTLLCLRGRFLLYDYCQANGIPHKKTGKIIVAQQDQLPDLKKLYNHACSLRLPHISEPASPVRLLSGDEARLLEPSLSPAIAGAIWSPETGVIDSHAFMASLERDVGENSLSYSTQVVRIDASQENPGWVVQFITSSGTAAEVGAVHARTLINAAGLSAPLLTNTILPKSQWIPSYFARGSYVTCSKASRLGIERLIYPMPVKGMAGLGTHLTIDLGGGVRFGPDVEWLAPREEDDDPEPWKAWLTPSDTRLDEMHRAIQSYLPGISRGDLAPDYVGIRPKLAGPDGGFRDFTIRTDYAHKKNRQGRMISLLGIESPGLTSSLAIAEVVVDELL